MKTNLAREGDRLTVSLVGRLDGHSVQTAEQSLLAEIGPPIKTMILDFTGLEYVSSVGLRLVLLMAKRLKQAGGTLRLCGMQPSVQEVFEVSGLMRILTVHPTCAEATEAALQAG